MKKTIKVAACQMASRLCDSAYNLTRAETLVTRAFEQGAHWVVVPEFFSTSMAYNPCMLKAAVDAESAPVVLLRELAQRYQGYVAGSIIMVSSENSQKRRNVFLVAHPDGAVDFHNKSIPSFWENCYYQGGEDRGVLHVDGFRIGSAVCYEFWQWDTARRLLGRIDFLLGGAAWWNLPTNWFPQCLWKGMGIDTQNVTAQTVSVFAQILGVPVVNACAVGPMRSNTPMIPCLPYKSYFLGETQIVDGRGTVLARMSPLDGEGVITAEIEPGPVPPSIPISPRKFWIPKLSLAQIVLRICYYILGIWGRLYYRRMVKKGIY